MCITLLAYTIVFMHNKTYGKNDIICKQTLHYRAVSSTADNIKMRVEKTNVFFGKSSSVI